MKSTMRGFSFVGFVSAVVVLLLVGIAAYALFTNSAANNPLPEEASGTPLSEYFQAELTEPVSPDGPIPIEGYDAELLLGRYPGLAPEDFDGVAALQGHYTFEEGEAVFTLTEAFEHSAARTVSPEGYAVLLENVSARLSVPARTEAEIDALIAALE